MRRVALIVLASLALLSPASAQVTPAYGGCATSAYAFNWCTATGGASGAKSVFSTQPAFDNYVSVTGGSPSGTMIFGTGVVGGVAYGGMTTNASGWSSFATYPHIFTGSASPTGDNSWIYGIPTGGFHSFEVNTVPSFTVYSSRVYVGSVTPPSTLNSRYLQVFSNDATAFEVGIPSNDMTTIPNPVFKVNAAAASVATGVSVVGAAAGGGVAVAATSSGTDENITLNAKGAGTITIGNVSTGAITLSRATTVSAALTYGGVTLTNAVTGTGKMVLDTSPVFTTPALGTPSSGVVTNLTGTASININGTVGATTPATGAFTTGTFSSATNNTLGTAASGAVQVTAGGLGVSGNFTAGGGVSALTTSGFYFGATQAMFVHATNYTRLNDPLGALKMIIGNSNDPTTYARNNTFIWQVASGASNLATMTTGSLSAIGTAAWSYKMDRNTTAATAGQGLTIDSGGAIAGTNNLAGGDLTLKSGISTGTGTSSVIVATPTPSGSGSTDNTPTTRLTVDSTGLTLTTLQSDTAQTDATLCARTSDNLVMKGTGTLGICLGTSSARFKNNIASMEVGLEAINKLRPVNFYYKKGYGDEGVRKQYGFLAEEVVDVIPDLVGRDRQGKPLSVDIVGLTPIIVKSLQELKAANDNLRAEVERLKRGKR